MFYFYLPNYVYESNGISLLYEIASTLNAIGKPTKVLCYEKRDIKHPVPSKEIPIIIFLEEKKINLEATDIVIYTDTITGNPLQAKQVVRYLLNKPFFLVQEPILYGYTDYIMSYSNYISQNLPQLFYLKDERAIFQPLRNNSKKGTILYFGKTNPSTLADQLKIFDTIKKDIPKPITAIVRSYPSSHQETLNWLSKSELLISFDGMTNICYEATLLETPVLILDKSYYISDIPFNIKRNGLFYDYQELKESKEKIISYNYYNQYLNQQKRILNDCFNNILLHFEKVKKNQNYKDFIKRKNIRQIDIDKREWIKSKKYSFYNIISYNDLPTPIFKLLFHHTSISSFHSRFIYNIKKILKHLGLFNITKKLYIKIKHLL